jgi:hypothetical protein
MASVLLLAFAGRAPAKEAYYVLLFGSQQTPNNPTWSHSFATFVRAIWADAGPPRLEAYTISWFPRGLYLRIFTVAPEPGINLDLHSTLRYLTVNHERVSLWGPYQITPELYWRAVAQVGLLQSGRVLYKAVDTGYSSDLVSNCIHAVSSVAEGNRLSVTRLSWGETASYMILDDFMPWIIEPRALHTWVSRALGLGRFPIVYRLPGENPRSGIVQSAYRSLLGEGTTVQASYGSPW